MIQLLVGLTFFALFVILIFASSVSIPIYTLTSRGHWGWAAGYALFTAAWLWGMHHFGISSSAPDAPFTAAQLWWNQYWWISSLAFYQGVGLTLGLLVRRQSASGWVMLLPVVCGGLVILGAVATVVIIGPHYLGQDVTGFVANEVQQLTTQSLAYYEAAGLPADQLVLLKGVGDQLGHISFQMLPATVWLMGLAATMLTLLLGKWFVPRALWMKYQGGLTRWKLPGVCIWMVLVLGGFFLLDLRGMKIPWALALVSNGLLVLGGLFLLQGAMIVTYYIRRQRDGVFRWVWYGFILLFFQMALFAMVVMGLFDYWVDFRRIDKKIVL